MSARRRFNQFKEGYCSFIEKRGFSVIIGVCVAVIAVSAMLSGHTTLTAPAPTSPVLDAHSVAQLMQESLADAVSATPAPTPSPVGWQSPLEEIIVLREFRPEQLVYCTQNRIWSVHDSVDLKAVNGDPVYAISDGVVQRVSEKGLDGACIVVRHGDQTEAEYASLHLTAGLQAGDPVQCGQVLGFAGNTKQDETDLGPHLHLRVTKNQKPIDPLSLWQQ